MLDGGGNIATTGFFSGTADFDPGSGTFDLCSTGSSDAFVSKLDSAGNFVWARHLGGSSRTEAYGIGVDRAGNVYTAGYFRGTADFDPGSGTFNLTSAGNGDEYVSKLDSAGNFIWARRVGGSGNDSANTMAVDGAGNVYTTGSFQGTADFDPGPGTFNLTSAGDDEVFVSKLDSFGNFVWARRLGDRHRDQGHGIAVDEAGSVFTIGVFGGTVDFDPGPGTAFLTSAGRLDAFVSKLDSSGDFVWAKRWGGGDGSTDATASDGGLNIALNGDGNVYTTGYFVRTVDFDPGPAIFNLTSAGDRDVFVSKLNSAGDFLSVSQIVGTGENIGVDIAVDNDGRIYTTGYFSGTADFDPGPGAELRTSAGGRDIFLALLGESKVVQAIEIDIKPDDGSNTIVLNGRGNLRVAVLTTVEFDATTVDIADRSQIRFGDVKLAESHRVSPVDTTFEDVDDDGDVDLVLLFSIEDIVETGALVGDTRDAEVTAGTLAGIDIRGTDAVTMKGTHIFHVSWSPTPGTPATATVYIHDHNGNISERQRARVDESISEVNQAVANLLKVVDVSDADIHLHNDSISSCADTDPHWVGCAVIPTFEVSGFFADGHYNYLPISQAVVTMRESVPWHVDSEPPKPGRFSKSSRFDYQSIVTQELGHAVGLYYHDQGKHPDFRTNGADGHSAMYPTLAPWHTHRKLSAFDTGWMNHLYGGTTAPTISKAQIKAVSLVFIAAASAGRADLLDGTHGVVPSGESIFIVHISDPVVDGDADDVDQGLDRVLNRSLHIQFIDTARTNYSWTDEREETADDAPVAIPSEYDFDSDAVFSDFDGSLLDIL